MSSAHVHTLYPHVTSEQNESSERAEPQVSFKTPWLVFGQEIGPVSDFLIYALRPVPVTGNGHRVVLSYPLSHSVDRLNIGGPKPSDTRLFVY